MKHQHHFLIPTGNNNLHHHQEIILTIANQTAVTKSQKMLDMSCMFFGLGFGASEMEVKVELLAILGVYHPNQYSLEIAGMNDDKSTELFNS